MFYWDGVGFALVLEHPGWFKMIEPNHPIYIGFGWLGYRLVRMIAPATAALRFLQALNSVLAAACVVVMYAIARRIIRDRFAPAALALLFALSATWWKFATDANAYVPSILFLMLAASLLLPGRQPRPLAVALLHATAMLFHELAVLFVAPAAVGIYLQSRGTKTRVRVVAQYVVLAFGLSSAAYYTCFRLATGGTRLPDYLRWIAYHSPDSNFSFSLARNIWLTIRGMGRLILGGRLTSFHSGFAQLAVLLLLLTLGAILTLRSRNQMEGRPALEVSSPFLWSWVIVYLVFLTFWLPQNTFYRLFYWPPLVLLFGTTLHSRNGRAALAITVAFLGTWNFLFYIYPNSLAGSNPVLGAALEMKGIWKPGTWVYQGSFNTDNWTIFCFNPQVNFKDLDRSRLPEMTAEMKAFEKIGHETWIDQSSIDLLRSDSDGRQWLFQHTRPEFRRELGDAKHRVSFERVFP